MILESVLPDERVTVPGVQGKRVVVLGQDGMLLAFEMRAHTLEIPRCPVLLASALVSGPPGAPGTSTFREQLVVALAAGRRVLRAVHWPAWFDMKGMIRAEEAIGIIMLDGPGRPSPTPKQWAAAVAHLRILERHAR